MGHMFTQLSWVIALQGRGFHKPLSIISLPLCSLLTLPPPPWTTQLSQDHLDTGLPLCFTTLPPSPVCPGFLLFDNNAEEKVSLASPPAPASAGPEPMGRTLPHLRDVRGDGLSPDTAPFRMCQLREFFFSEPQFSILWYGNMIIPIQSVYRVCCEHHWAVGHNKQFT